ncbi:SARS [Acanthosepion pharaonis]|uniref:SARS n=1 Tax=Acanthosepion pharaonis TaxID=158019 RepID=A0A812CXP7_ACAPH|nr:SARS [Sepia pharaonis]
MASTSSSASGSLHPKNEKAQTTFSRLEKFDWDYLCNLKNTDEIRQNIQCRKGIGDIDTLLRVWKQFGQEDDPDEKQRLMLQLEQLASDIPNKKHPQAPVGDESCAQLVKMIGQPQADDKIKQPIVQLAEKAGWLRISNLGISTGQRSYFLQNQFAHLEQALVRFTLDRLQDQGFQLVSVPEILKPEIIEGCGFTTTGVIFKFSAWGYFFTPVGVLGWRYFFTPKPHKLTKTVSDCCGGWRAAVLVLQASLLGYSPVLTELQLNCSATALSIPPWGSVFMLVHPLLGWGRWSLGCLCKPHLRPLLANEIMASFLCVFFPCDTANEIALFL